MIKEYSYKRDGDVALSDHFHVREFRCKDGTDYLKVDDNLIHVLELVRCRFKKAVNITSGYRTLSHNSKVGGTKSSYHLEGRAADIVVTGINAKAVYQYLCELMEGWGGVIYYKNSNFCHVDTRSKQYREMKNN